MGTRWGRKSTGWDQPLPWLQDVDLSESAAERRGPEKEDPPALPARGDEVPGLAAAGDQAAPADVAIEVDLTNPEPARRPAAIRRSRHAKSGLTPEQRTLQARAAAYRLHATHDPKETTKSARAAFSARFEREVDPEMVLPPAERARRAEAARRAYFTTLALRSSRARAQRRRSGGSGG